MMFVRMGVIIFLMHMGVVLFLRFFHRRISIGRLVMAVIAVELEMMPFRLVDTRADSTNSHFLLRFQIASSDMLMLFFAVIIRPGTLYPSLKMSFIFVLLIFYLILHC